MFSKGSVFLLSFFLLLSFESREARSDALRVFVEELAANSLSLLRLPANLLGNRVFMSEYRSTFDDCPKELDRLILFLLFIGGRAGILVATLVLLVGFWDWCVKAK